MREFSVIDSAKSVEQLKMRLKDGELEQYGDSFTPDFVYDVMRRLPRFVTMQVSLNVLFEYVFTNICNRGDTNKTRKNSLAFCLKGFMMNVYMS